MKGSFTYIVDTGCSFSCTPDINDFASVVDIKEPIILKGVTGDIECTKGGTIKLETIDNKGEIMTIMTPGYYNLSQGVRLFSPQAHFWMELQKKGEFSMSWAKPFSS